MPKFPADLALAVAKRWDNLVTGHYVVPDCPPLRVLKRILESSYLAASAAEEGRYPQFNVLVTRKTVGMAEVKEIFPFEQARPLTVSELRGLAPASDVRKSAIWVGYEGEIAVILGLIDLGTSWHRARLGFTYKYSAPSNLIVQVDRPGRLKVYQGEFHVATLVDGDLVVSGDIDLNLFLHGVVNQGLERLVANFAFPKYEDPRDFENFWFIAYWNVFAAVANSISLSGHGGMLVIANRDSDQIMSCLRVKYSGSTDMLRSAFSHFINARNRTSDFYEKSEQKKREFRNAYLRLSCLYWMRLIN